MAVKYVLKFSLFLFFGLSFAQAQQRVVAFDDAFLKDRKMITDAGNIDWSRWYLSVPLDRGGGRALAISSDEIVSNRMNTEAMKYFFQNTDGSFTMRARFTGFTTSGKAAINGRKYCRTELRELWRGKTDNSDNWLMDAGTHILETTLRVEKCEGNAKMIVAQIHGKESKGVKGSPATVKIRWHDGGLIVDHYQKPTDNGVWVNTNSRKIPIGYVGNEVFTLKLKVKKGKFYYALSCEARGIEQDYKFVYNFRKNGYRYANYFKTGNYFIWNQDTRESAQLRLFDVKTKHIE